MRVISIVMLMREIDCLGIALWLLQNAETYVYPSGWIKIVSTLRALKNRAEYAMLVSTANPKREP
ncbi:MAG: hypothetical protein KDB22_12640 [Planctomycetales bacterium]|nr:hypothetical protein [Planctomycetales bacterium]